MTFPLRETSSSALNAWRALSTVFLPYTAMRLVAILSAAAHLNGWQSLFAATPCLAALLIVSLWEMFSRPATFRAAYPWRRVSGKRVVVFYPPGNVAADAKEIALKGDALVTQIEGLLEVKPLTFRIGIFLCGNREDLRRLMRTKNRLADGYAFANAILLVYNSWLDLQGTIAHELTHTIAMQRLHRDLMPLLNEGLAEYGMSRAVRSAHEAISVPLSLGMLAHSGVFYDWLSVEDPDHPAGAKYAHAAALVDYLIGRYGLVKFKALCLQTVHDPKQNSASQLHKAVSEIYGLSLQRLEQDWRREWIGPGQIEQS